MRYAWITAVLALLAASPAAARQSPPTPAAAAAADPVAGVRWIYDTVKGYLTRAADQMPEADYAFRPTPEVRSFGQLLGHIANAQYNYCSNVLGEQSPSRRNLEEITAKAEMVAALNASFEYCGRAYAVSDTRVMEMTQLYGGERTRLAVLEFNVAHDFEHYGNIVTYMRLKGMVPPSSQGGGDM